MYEYRKELCETLNLKAIMFGGRIPNYYKYADQIRPKEYIDKVKQKEIFDPVLTFQLSIDFHVRKVLRNYLPAAMGQYLLSGSHTRLCKPQNHCPRRLGTMADAYLQDTG